MAIGFVYILVSPNSDYIKIGGTEHPVSKRIKEINSALSYAAHGPWQLSDFLHVTDWPLVESQLHRHFNKDQIRSVPGTRELFKTPPHAARKQLRLTDSALRIGHEKTALLFRNRDLQLYLFKLFQLSGLFGHLDIQGAWTLTILTSTVGGRLFTLNIGRHEVAFTPRERKGEVPAHYLVLDRLILDYADTLRWIATRGGKVQASRYKSARERSVLIYFKSEFAEAEAIFGLPGIRRALVAYWSESLADLRERNAKSTYARYHSYDAVAALLEYKRATESVFVDVQ
jgi:hypothetical protein